MWRSFRNGSTLQLVGADTARVSVYGPAVVSVCKRAVLLIPSALLIVSAVAKSHEAIVNPLPARGWFDAPWATIDLIASELIVGAWLLSGVAASFARAASLALYTLFAGASLSSATNGEASCGCFGAIAVSPWATFFLDCGAIAILSISSRNSARRYQRQRPLVLVGAIASMPLVVALLSASSSRALASGINVVGNSISIVAPDRWVGRRFPLMSHIQDAGKLGDGDWLLILFRPGCERCHETIRKIERFAAEGALPPSLRTALVLVPPSRSDSEHTRDRTVWETMTLDASYHWLTRTPVVVLLREGGVRAAGYENLDVAALFRGPEE